jgi:FkbM family methyltransferase
VRNDTAAGMDWRSVGKVLRSEVKRLAKKPLGFFHPSAFALSLWERKRLEYFPRYKHTHSPLLGKSVELTDSFWYLFSHREIFIDEVYKFEANSETPLIIDCGANIGLSIIYFKNLYPNSRIIGFEPDPEIFRVLQTNVNTFGFTNVELWQKALWNSDTGVLFRSEGSLGGAIGAPGIAKDEMIQVQSVRLGNFLNQKVDFLKIDIEGAEYEVLQDCEEGLEKVDYIFVEYHGKPAKPQMLPELLKIIECAGFRYHIKDANPVRHPLVKYERNRYYDLQLNIFCYRESLTK